MSERLISRILYLLDRGRSFIWKPCCQDLRATYPKARPCGTWYERPTLAFLFGLAPHGVCRATHRCRWCGALLPHPLTLTGPSRDSLAVYSLLHFPSRHRASPLASMLLVGVRTFLSSFEKRTSRSRSDRLSLSDSSILTSFHVATLFLRVATLQVIKESNTEGRTQSFLDRASRGSLQAGKALESA